MTNLSDAQKREYVESIAAEIKSEINRIYDEEELWADADVKLADVREGINAELSVLRGNVDQLRTYTEAQAEYHGLRTKEDPIAAGKSLAYEDMSNRLSGIRHRRRVIRYGK